MSLINQTVGNYKVTQLLGEGGMGVVYLAEHPVIGRKVAIKVLHISLAHDPEIVARFFNEARAIHMIGHENIVEILDFGQTPDGQPYFIMEFLEGESLADRMARAQGPVGLDETIEIAAQVCRALGAAHDKGIIHRDLKPHNIQLLTSAEGRPIVKILDFGVAKILSGHEDGTQSVKTRTGSLMGTPLYMSPEQCKGSGKLDHRTDIYSLGVIVYEMLAGHPPFEAEGVGEIFAKHMLEDPRSITDFAPDLPPHVASAVMRALEKDLEARFANMEELRQALLGEVVSPAPVASKTPAPARLSMRPSAVGAVAHGANLPLAATQTAAPQQTTLSSATSELDDEAPRRRRSRIGVLVGALSLGAAAVVAVVAMTRDGAAPAPAPPVHSAPPAAVPPTKPAMVRIRLEAEPAGVHVFRRSDDKELGTVPLDIDLPQGPGKVEYTLRMEGYKDRVVAVDLDEDHTFQLSLEKDTPPAPPTAEGNDVRRDRVEPARRRPRATARRTQVIHDEDGLATPSF